MDEKKCSKCNVPKPITEFAKQKTGKYGVTTVCKLCKRSIDKKYRADNSDKIKQYRLDNSEYFAKYRKLNKEKAKESSKSWYELNKEKVHAYQKQWKLDNKDKLIKYRADNKKKAKKYAQKYYLDNKEKHDEYTKQYRLQNKELVSELNRKYQKSRRERDDMFKLSNNLRTSINNAFKVKRWYKNNTTAEILGCDWETAHQHIENKFTDGMSWDNYPEWHIDHIIPLSSATTKLELLKLCHYTNLQPLWEFDNLSKGSIISEQWNNT